MRNGYFRPLPLRSALTLFFRKTVPIVSEPICFRFGRTIPIAIFHLPRLINNKRCRDLSRRSHSKRKSDCYRASLFLIDANARLYAEKFPYVTCSAEQIGMQNKIRRRNICCNRYIVERGDPEQRLHVGIVRLRL